MAISYATPADLAARWRPLTEAEQTMAAILLEDAAVRIDARCPPADPITDEAVRKIVSCAMVKRAMQAGIGGAPVTQQSQAVGAVSASFTFANPSGDLYLTKDDLRLLGCGRQLAFTVSMWPEVDDAPAVGE